MENRKHFNREPSIGERVIAYDRDGSIKIGTVTGGMQVPCAAYVCRLILDGDQKRKEWRYNLEDLEPIPEQYRRVSDSKDLAELIRLRNKWGFNITFE